MPKRTDIKSILIIGAGPIVIGQACEFDYSGVQACKALKDEGYRVVLINSNPATIMTDPGLVDATYIEPITPDMVAKIIEKEKPDAILPTMGGQTALNTAMALHRDGRLKKYGVELIGANAEAIDKAEDRLLFRDAMTKIGLESPKSEVVHNREEATAALDKIGLPAIIRPSFTLGGTGGGIAYNRDEFFDIVQGGLEASRISWYSLSVKVSAGATVTESPVCTPIGSTFSIEQMMMQLSLRSRTTSISYSFQPSTDSSTSTSVVGDASRPPCTMSKNSSRL